MKLIYKSLLKTTMTHHRKQYANGSQNDTVQPVLVYENSRHSTLLLNSDDKIDGTYADAIFQNNSRLIPGGITTIGLNRIIMDYRIPNINGRNSVLKFQIEGDITIYTSILATDNKNTVTEMYTSIVNRMNDLTPGIFSFTEATDGTVYLIATPGTKFKFLSCTFIDYGRYAHGLYYTTNFEQNIRTIARLQYTRYIDIGVSEIRNATINNNSFGSAKKFSAIEHLTRVHVDDSVTIPRAIKTTASNINYFAFRDRALTNMRVSLYDEYEQVLWSNVVNVSGELVGIPYVSYELDFTLIS